ncbi:MAG: hypothetical protein J2P25_14785 [Nocardiopsaceae bacterium]|nr:hypothetical protein [Nocardiopsaceae bacterium]
MTLRSSGGAGDPKKRRARLGRTVAMVAAVAGLTALAACGSAGSSLSGLAENGQYGRIPAATGTPHKGTIKIAQTEGMTPWILPIITSADNSIYTVPFFDLLQWRPLYWYPNGNSWTEDKQESMANDPKWSDGDKTVTLTLKPGYKWSDGQPVTSKDVLFAYDETKAAVKESPANWAGYTPGVGIPDQVASVTTPNSSTVTFHLKSPVNPTWFFQAQLAGFQPMPAHAWAKASAHGPALDFTNPANAKKIYDFLASQSKSVSTYASNPLWQVVDGPYKLTSFNNTNYDWSMAPNPKYGGPHAKVVSPVQMSYYSSEEAEYNAVKAGAATVGFVPLSDVPQAGSIKSSYDLYGYPSSGFHGIWYNFKDTTGHFNKIISQLYFRQALAHLDDQKGLVKAVYHGAGTPSYGILGKTPPSPYTPADSTTDPYPYSPSTAVSILKSHGWKVIPNGTSYCAKPGTGSGECGAGIPKGTKLAWNMPYAADNTTSAEMSTDFASALKAAGMQVNLQSNTFNHILEADNDVANPKNTNTWAMEAFGGENFTNPYTTTFGLFNTTGSSNFGGYSNPEADKLIKASVSSTNPGALKNELSYLAKNPPVWYEPSEDYASAGGLMAISKQVSGDPKSFAAYTQSFLLPEFWYFKK